MTGQLRWCIAAWGFRVPPPSVSLKLWLPRAYHSLEHSELIIWSAKIHANISFQLLCPSETSKRYHPTSFAFRVSDILSHMLLFSDPANTSTKLRTLKMGRTATAQEQQIHEERAWMDHCGPRNRTHEQTLLEVAASRHLPLPIDWNIFWHILSFMACQPRMTCLTYNNIPLFDATEHFSWRQ